MVKMIKKICMVLSLVLVFNSSASIALAADYLYLNINGEKQEQTWWCWAATSKSIIWYLNKGTPTQSDIVISVKGSEVNEGANALEERESLNNYNVTTTVEASSVSWTAIKDNIKGWYSPMKALVQMKSSGSGHDYVIYGYYDSWPTKNVSYMDPRTSKPTWNSKSYSEFVNNTEFSWYGTFHYNH